MQVNLYISLHPSILVSFFLSLLKFSLLRSIPSSASSKLFSSVKTTSTVILLSPVGTSFKVLRFPLANEAFEA